MEDTSEIGLDLNPDELQQPSISIDTNLVVPNNTERSQLPSISWSVNQNDYNQESNTEMKLQSFSQASVKSVLSPRSQEPSISQSIASFKEPDVSKQSINIPSISQKSIVSEKSREPSINPSVATVENQNISKPEVQVSQKPEDSNKIPESKAARNQRRYREMILKKELTTKKLEKETGDLKQHLGILESTIPAVMVWNILRKSQGTKVTSLEQMLKRQFRLLNAGDIYCPKTPNKHYDCRVREAEVNRKQAEQRVLGAKTLLCEKQALLTIKRQKLEEAKKIQQDRQEKINQLTLEAENLKKTYEELEHEDGSCIAGECKDIQCKQRILAKLSRSSINSNDIEYLDDLQQLAESELMMKKEIEDLQEREESYMKTLQQADELWSKIEGDSASDLKNATNQKLNDRIIELENELKIQKIKSDAYKSELEKLGGATMTETAIGGNDDLAEVRDQSISAKVKLKNRRTETFDDD